MGATVKGLEEWDKTLLEIAGRADDISPVGPEVHEEILRQSRRAKIPRVTGNLEDSIKNPNHPDHAYYAAPKRIMVRTLDKALIFNTKYSPPIDPAPLLDLIADYVTGDTDD